MLVSSCVRRDGQKTISTSKSLTLPHGIASGAKGKGLCVRPGCHVAGTEEREREYFRAVRHENAFPANDKSRMFVVISGYLSSGRYKSHDMSLIMIL